MAAGNKRLPTARQAAGSRLTWLLAAPQEPQTGSAAPPGTRPVLVNAAFQRHARLFGAAGSVCDTRRPPRRRPRSRGGARQRCHGDSTPASQIDVWVLFVYSLQELTRVFPDALCECTHVDVHVHVHTGLNFDMLEFKNVGIIIF